jgi:putative transcriptional regulator
MKKESIFKDLKQSLNEALEDAQGKKELRTTILPAPPPNLTALEIKKMRESLGVSQSVFAKGLNVSVKTVQSWEQNLKKPSGASLKLLSLTSQKPDLIFGKLQTKAEIN